MTSHLQLLSLPLELRYHLFRTIIYTSHVIHIGHGVSDNRKTQENGKVNVSTSGRLKNHLVDLNPESGGPFEALSLTCTQLRNEIAEWFRIEQNMCKIYFSQRLSDSYTEKILYSALNFPSPMMGTLEKRSSQAQCDACTS